jgi:N utilization substance protein B
MIDGTRHEARERAVNLLYEADIKNVAVAEIIHSLSIPLEAYTDVLIAEVEKNHEAIDKQIELASQDWSIERMPIIDRNVLRIATAELLTQHDVPTAVIIDEAVELVKQFSTEDSNRFINGVLSAVASEVRTAQ